MPTRVYSAGMSTRLSFAISTMNAPDILLIDETFGTGDVAFQKKARKRVADMIKKTSILLFASHDPGVLKEFCTHALLLSRGKVEMIGDIEELLQVHEQNQLGK